MKIFRRRENQLRGFIFTDGQILSCEENLEGKQLAVEFRDFAEGVFVLRFEGVAQAMISSGACTYEVMGARLDADGVLFVLTLSDDDGEELLVIEYKRVSVTKA